MPPSTETIFESRGQFWWLGEKLPRGHSASSFGALGMLLVQEDGLARVNVISSLLRRDFIGLASSDLQSLADDPDGLKGKTVAGRLEDGRWVYLKNLVFRPFGRGLDGKPTEEINSSLCLVGYGASHGHEKALRFSMMSLGLAGLEAWRWEDALSVAQERENNSTRLREVTYKTAPVEYELNDGRLVLVTDVHCTAFENTPHREVTFKQYDKLQLHRTRPAGAEEMHTEFKCLEEFLAILTGTYHNLPWPSVLLEGKKTTETYTLYFWRHVEKARQIDMSTLWTTFPQVKDTFGGLYSCWRRKRLEYGPGFYLYIGALRDWPMYIEHRFVNLIWGIESLHRGINPAQRESKSYNKIVEGVISKAGTLLNSAERRWLQQELQASVEPPLENRISSIFGALPWGITKESLDAFAIRCRIRRNNISHYGGSADKEESRDSFLKDLMQLTEGLTPLYHAALLQEIGADEKTLLNCTQMPVGSRIRRGLEVAKVRAEGIRPRESPDLAALKEAHEKHVAAWRRKQVRSKRRNPDRGVSA